MSMKVTAGGVVDPSKISSAAAGVGSAPVELWVDEHGRPVRMSMDVTVSGQKVTTQLEMTKYNQPVKISAPPAGQVSTD